jgi:hypothetical protein
MVTLSRWLTRIFNRWKPLQISRQATPWLSKQFSRWAPTCKPLLMILFHPLCSKNRTLTKRISTSTCSELKLMV